MYLSPVPMADL